MTAAQSRFVHCADCTIHVKQWGNPAKESLIIWHGITGTCSDHDALAAKLSKHYYVLCPDAVGCGLSSWPSNHEQPSLEFHVRLVDDLLLQLGISKTRWLGTSKGGALGMLYAATGKTCTIEQLLLHDVGPGLPEKFRDAVAGHIAQPPRFDSLPAFQAHLEKTLGRGGLELEPQQWQQLACNWHRRCDDGMISYHYSPALAEQFAHHPQNFDLWDTWEKIDTNTLLLRGEASNVVTDKEAERMENSGPKCNVITRKGGHISFLTTAQEQEIVLNFFANHL